MRAAAEHFRTRIQSGMTFLDTVYPGWQREIDIDRLDMSSLELCVLGQLYGGYVPALAHFKYMHDFDPVRLGFSLHSQLDLVFGFDVLTCMWKVELNKERTQTQARKNIQEAAQELDTVPSGWRDALAPVSTSTDPECLLGIPYDEGIGMLSRVWYEELYGDTNRSS